MSPEPMTLADALKASLKPRQPRRTEMDTQTPQQHDDALTEQLADALSEIVHHVPRELATSRPLLVEQARQLLAAVGLLGEDGTDGS